jgi:hypothetical protein
MGGIASGIYLDYGKVTGFWAGIRESVFFG